MNSGIAIHNLTVVIPTYNRIDMLKRILDTIPRSIRVIVSDNGSSVPAAFEQEYPEFTFFKTPKVLEALENWNNCINLVETEWFTIPSDDDLYYSNSFELIAKYLKKFKNNDVLVFGHNEIDANNQVTSVWIPGEDFNVSPPHSYLKFKYGVDARFPGLFFKKAIVIKHQCFDTSFKITAGDSKLIQQCMLTGTVSFIPEIVAAYRVWPNNSTMLTLGTAAWLSEIDRWQNDLLSEAETVYKAQQIPLDVKNIRDEVYARNLIGGVLNVKKRKGKMGGLKFALENRFPRHANMRTLLSLVKGIIT
jgi:hypothetical protein